MKKFLIGGVSLFAILSAVNAMAAGYTCEELIEYTSCNEGYYLSAGALTCPDGYTFVQDVCEDAMGSLYYVSSEECNEVDSGVHMQSVCLDDLAFQNSSSSESNNDQWYVEPTAASATTCSTCPTGAYCTGGTTAATPCPAGSYCATTGLSQPTGLCAQNSYSTGGATACISCPDTDLTDKDGKTVVAKTATTGTDSPSKCFIDPDAYFKNTKGIYHFKSNCSYAYNIDPDSLTEEEKIERCESFGGTWSDVDGYFSSPVCYAGRPSLPDNEEDCLALGAGFEWVQPDDNYICECVGDPMTYDIVTGKLGCL